MCHTLKGLLLLLLRKSINKLYNWSEGHAIKGRKQVSLSAGTSMKGKVEVQTLVCPLEHSS